MFKRRDFGGSNQAGGREERSGFNDRDVGNDDRSSFNRGLGSRDNRGFRDDRFGGERSTFNRTENRTDDRRGAGNKDDLFKKKGKLNITFI